MLTTYPRLRKLELWFPLPISAYYTERVELEKPYMTFSAPSIFFSYLRKRGSKVTELVVHFGARAGWTGMSMFHDHDHVAENSTTFRCELAERDWDAAQERFTTTCLDVRDSTNEWMRAKQGQISPLENSEIADYADFMAVLGRGGRMDVDHSTSEVKFAGAMFNKDAKWAFRTGGLARRPLARGTTTQGLRSRRWRRRISVIAVVTWVSELRMGRVDVLSPLQDHFHGLLAIRLIILGRVSTATTEPRPTPESSTFIRHQRRTPSSLALTRHPCHGQASRGCPSSVSEHVASFCVTSHTRTSSSNTEISCRKLVTWRLFHGADTSDFGSIEIPRPRLA